MPIDLNTTAARQQLQAIYDRIIESEIAHDIAQGTWRPRDDYLLPGTTQNVRKRAYRRALRQLQTLGPRIMHTKRAAIVGSLQWGGDDNMVDERLRALKLRDLATRLADGLIIDGLAAGMAHLDENGQPRITRLGGYLQPYTDPTNMDVITGLYQAWSTSVFTSEKLTSGARDSDFDTNDTNYQRAYTWTVRIYDWSDGEQNATIREWRNLNNPTHLGLPSEEIENAPIPRIAIANQTDDGLPLGELLQAVPSLMALWKTEANMTLVEELASFPMLVVKGGEVEAVGPAEPVVLDADGDVKWLEPGQMEQIRAQRHLRMERIREDLALPGGFIGNDSPSGEAFREANVRFRQNAGDYAMRLTDLLTELVADYSALTNITPQTVSITPTAEYDFADKAQWALSLYQAGIIPLQVAAREMQQYFGHWDDESLEEWLDEQTGTITVDDLRRDLGAIGGA